MTQSRVSIVGAGIKIPDHMTIEGLSVLQSCDEVWTVLQESPQTWSLTKNCTAKVHKLTDDYSSNERRSVNYQSAVQRMVNRALQGYHICYLTYGNPTYFDSVCAGLIEQCEISQVSCKIYAGVSSFDLVFNELEKDTAPGVLVLEVNRFLAEQKSVSPDVSVLLTQVGLLERSIHTPASATYGGKLAPLVDAITDLFGSEHQVSLVRSTNRASGENGFVKSMPIEHLPRVSEGFLLGSSLFVPARKMHNKHKTKEPHGLSKDY